MAQRTHLLKATAASNSPRAVTETSSALGAETRPAAIGWAKVIRGAFPVALFLLGTALLLIQLGAHPAYAYNWESYTSWRFFAWWDNPSTSILDINDGLMTDSGDSPLVVPIIWLSFKILGVGLLAMRLPVALVTAASLPLTWIVGRRLVGERAAVLAAVLLSLLPSYLIYGRTATTVGISLVPALITIYLLIRALQEPRRAKWLVLLQLMLILNSFAYSPIRFLWPISVALFLVEIPFRREVRRRLALGLLITVFTLPLVLAVIESDRGFNPIATVGDYYYARGEQVFAWADDPEQYAYFLEPTNEEAAAGRLHGSEEELAWRLIKKNAGDFTNLLLDRDTAPAITQFWNPHGRLYFGFLVPFFLIGLVRSLLNVFRRTEDRVLLACSWGFSLPLLLTSQVHIGRLIYALPFICLFVASGLLWIVDFTLARRRDFQPRWLPAVVTSTAALLLVVATARASWVDYRNEPPPIRDERIIAQLAASANEIAGSGGNAVLVRADDNPETEAITVSTYRIGLDNRYQFVNLRALTPFPTGNGKSAVIYGVVLPLLDKPDRIPAYCSNTYFVDPEIMPDYREKTSGASSDCGHPLRTEALVT
jgi:4-amino-4-deoxy-L-arabinose transferase-like glycosyltransferase